MLSFLSKLFYINGLLLLIFFSGFIFAADTDGCPELANKVFVPALLIEYPPENRDYLFYCPLSKESGPSSPKCYFLYDEVDKDCFFSGIYASNRDEAKQKALQVIQSLHFPLVGEKIWVNQYPICQYSLQVEAFPSVKLHRIIR